MKKTCLGLLLLLLVQYVSAQQYTVGSYNLRFDNPSDSGNLWVNRAPVVAALIRFHEYDILGTQEGLLNQLQDINKALPEYERYGIGRDDGKDAGEHSAIFFKKDKFELLQKGDFWLSETPEKPSRGWDSRCCNRICTWVKLKDKKSGKQFFFFNAHYEYEGQGRVESSKLILQKIKTIAAGLPVLLSGDFNGSHETEWYQLLANSVELKDSYKQVTTPYAVNASYNGFGRNQAGNDIIDHVFVSRQFKVTKWGILTDSYHGKYPSDHFPVLVRVSL